MSESILLWECFVGVPDLRDAPGRRHPLVAISVCGVGLGKVRRGASEMDCGELCESRKYRARPAGRGLTGSHLSIMRREKADAHNLLSLVRGHWAIENVVSYVCDVTKGEDHCRVRKRSPPRQPTAATCPLQPGRQRRSAQSRRPSAGEDPRRGTARTNDRARELRNRRGTAAALRRQTTACRQASAEAGIMGGRHARAMETSA
jgi:hypothetical protein